VSWWCTSPCDIDHWTLTLSVMKAGLWLTILGMHTCISRCLQAVCCWVNDFLMQCSFVFWMWWVWSGNVKPTVLQQWRLRSPFYMNHCAPRVRAECGAHKFFLHAPGQDLARFRGTRTEKPQEGPLCPEGLRNPFLTSFENPWTKSQNLKNPVVDGCAWLDFNWLSLIDQKLFGALNA
jgi:hypothetical protein